MNNLTLLETILIIYILLNWFLLMMFAILPKRVTDKMSFIFIIICPPLIIGVIGDLIGDLIKRKHDKRKEQKEELKNE